MGRIEDGHFVIQHLVVYYFMSTMRTGTAAATSEAAARG
jgi:hypothetical protein